MLRVSMMASTSSSSSFPAVSVVIDLAFPPPASGWRHSPWQPLPVSFEQRNQSTHTWGTWLTTTCDSLFELFVDPLSAAFLHPFRCSGRLGDRFLAACAQGPGAGLRVECVQTVCSRSSFQRGERKRGVMATNQKQTMRRSLCDGGQRQSLPWVGDG